MRNLFRNQRRFWYCTYDGDTTIVDEFGNDTGEPCVSYKAPVEALGNISAATGRAEQLQFGLGIEYDKVVQLPGTDWDIAEDSLLFIDAVPPSVADNSVPFDGTNVEADYAVVRVAKSLNQTSIAVKRLRDG